MINIEADVNGTRLAGNRNGYRDMISQIDDDRRTHSVSIDNTQDL